LVTIDSLANLSILFDSPEKEHQKIAEKHADTVLKHFLREDGKGVWEMVNFGDKVEKLHIHGRCNTGMLTAGSKDGSGWSRGIAYAIYGFAQAAEATGRKEFGQAAQKLIDGFVASLPTDGVPFW
jgi:unsaturated chondroitin disaccharide hydrolase